MPNDELRLLIADMAPLDLPLRQLPERSLQWIETFRTAPRDSFEKIIETALEQHVQAVLLTGQLISDNPTRSCMHHLHQSLAVLKEEGIETFYLPAPGKICPNFTALNQSSDLALLFEGEALQLQHGLNWMLCNGKTANASDSDVPVLSIHNQTNLPSDTDLDPSRFHLLTGAPSFQDHINGSLSLGPALLHHKPKHPTNGQGATLLRWSAETGWDCLQHITATVQRSLITLDLDRLESLDLLTETLELELLEQPSLQSGMVRLIDWKLTSSNPAIHAFVHRQKQDLFTHLQQLDTQQSHQLQLQTKVKLVNKEQVDWISRLHSLTKADFDSLAAEIFSQQVDLKLTHRPDEQTYFRVLELLDELFRTRNDTHSYTSDAA